AIDGRTFDGGDLTITLIADGCPVLSPGTVDATVNGRAMTVDPGHHGSGTVQDPCYQPVFHLEPLPTDLGSTLTIEIKDASETLRVVISSFHSSSPELETPTGTAMAVHRGDTLSFSFAGASPDDPPDYAGASFENDGTPTDG